MSALEAIRKRAADTRDVINGARQRNNYIIESPALLDREALLRALDSVMEAVPVNAVEPMRRRIEDAIAQ